MIWDVEETDGPEMSSSLDIRLHARFSRSGRNFLSDLLSDIDGGKVISAAIGGAICQERRRIQPLI